jgi:hypothetical protein
VPNDGGDSIFPRLPANGKIDLLDQNGIEILPGRTLLVEIDIDANKSIHIVGAGNSGKYNFRPVVKVDFMDGGLPDKLARIEGLVNEVTTDPSNSFLLCHVDTPDECIDINTDMSTSFFDDEGLGTDFMSVVVGGHAVVFGRYSIDGMDIDLNALVVESGGNAEQLTGSAASLPADSEFLMVVDENGDIVVELQPGTRYFDADGEIGSDAIVIGTNIEVEGVQPPKVDVEDPDLIRAALVFVEDADDEQIAGTIIEPLDTVDRSFGLTLTEGGDTCVRVDDDADILLVDVAASEVTMGTIDDLAVDQLVDLFGATAEDSCFDAN